MNPDEDIVEELISRPLFDDDFLHLMTVRDYRYHRWLLCNSVPQELEEFMEGYLTGDSIVVEFRKHRWLSETVGALVGDFMESPLADALVATFDWKLYVEVTMTRAALVAVHGHERAFLLAASELTMRELEELNPDDIAALPDEYLITMYPMATDGTAWLS